MHSVTLRQTDRRTDDSIMPTGDLAKTQTKRIFENNQGICVLLCRYCAQNRERTTRRPSWEISGNPDLMFLKILGVGSLRGYGQYRRVESCKI